jgi:hypothetical protein
MWSTTVVVAPIAVLIALYYRIHASARFSLPRSPLGSAHGSRLQPSNLAGAIPDLACRPPRRSTPPHR